MYYQNFNPCRDEILDMTLTWLDSVRLTLENLEKVPEADKFEYESSRGTFMDYLGKVSLLLRIVRESGTRQEAGAQDTNQIIERLFRFPIFASIRLRFCACESTQKF